MNWLDILQLSTALLTQALAAFAAGHRKESPATVTLDPVHAATVQALGGNPPPTAP